MDGERCRDGLRKRRGEGEADKKREGGFDEELEGREKKNDGRFKDEVMDGCVEDDGEKEGGKAGWRE